MNVAPDVAEAEFDRFCAAMDIDADVTGEDKAGFDKQKTTLLKALQSGALVIHDSGEPEYSPVGITLTKPIHFFEPTGATYMAMDRKKDGHNIGKLHAMLADMTKENPQVFAAMKQRDYRVCQAIILLFLG